MSTQATRALLLGTIIHGFEQRVNPRGLTQNLTFGGSWPQMRFLL